MSSVVELDADIHEVLRYYEERGWTDGLPIVPPAEDVVNEALRHTDLDPDESLGNLPPAGAPATVRVVAVNAVMAGCRPEYLPVVLAAIRAIATPSFNLSGMQATTNPVTPLVVVNGALARELGFNGRGNCFGPGSRANSTVGRTVRLCMLNIGGGTPLSMDKSTHGQPGKYGMCIAENEEDSPWEPYSVEHGFGADSTVSVFGVTGTHNVIDAASRSADGILRTFAGSCVTIGNENMQLGGGPVLIIGPEHAQILHEDGYSKDDVRESLYEMGRLRVSDFPEGTLNGMVRHRRPKRYRSTNPDATIPFADSPSDIRIIVAGGPGVHSVLAPILGEVTKPATVPITNRVIPTGSANGLG